MEFRPPPRINDLATLASRSSKTESLAQKHCDGFLGHQSGGAF
jgi:hypothetical protein